MVVELCGHACYGVLIIVCMAFLVYVLPHPVHCAFMIPTLARFHLVYGDVTCMTAEILDSVQQLLHIQNSDHECIGTKSDQINEHMFCSIYI